MSKNGYFSIDLVGNVVNVSSLNNFEFVFLPDSEHKHHPKVSCLLIYDMKNRLLL